MLLDKNGHVKLSDFGLSKEAIGEAVAVAATSDAGEAQNPVVPRATGAFAERVGGGLELADTEAQAAAGSDRDDEAWDAAAAAAEAEAGAHSASVAAAACSELFLLRATSWHESAVVCATRACAPSAAR